MYRIIIGLARDIFVNHLKIFPATLLKVVGDPSNARRKPGLRPDSAVISGCKT